MVNRFLCAVVMVFVGMMPVSADSKGRGPLDLALETPLEALPALPVEGVIVSPPEPQEAAELLRQGHDAAELKGNVIDVPTALDCFRKAAALGSFEAANEFAYLMRSGGALPEQKAASIRITRYLAANGYGPAAYSMGMLGFMGRLGPEDGSQAAGYWFNIARRAGNASARKLRADTLQSLRDQHVLPPGTGDGDLAETAFVFTDVSTRQDGAVATEKTIAALFPGWTQFEISDVTVGNKVYSRHILADGKGRKIAMFIDITDWH